MDVRRDNETTEMASPMTAARSSGQERQWVSCAASRNLIYRAKLASTTATTMENAKKQDIVANEAQSEMCRQLRTFCRPASHI